MTIVDVAQTNVELTRRGFEAALMGDFDAIGALLDSDVKWHGGDPSAAGSCQNRRQALEVMRLAYERGRLSELVEVTAAGDKVIVVMRPPSQDGNQASLIANLTSFRNGKVVEMVHYADPDEARAAAGV